MTQITEMLRRLRGPFRQLDKDKFTDIHEQQKIAKRKLEESKVIWLNQGDQCNRIFMVKIKQRQLQAYVYSILDEDGTKVEGFNNWDYAPKHDTCWYLEKLCKVKEEFKLGCRTANRWEWGGKVYGNYNMQAGYKWYMNSMEKPKWAKVVWSKLSLPRHSFFAWFET
ncbi:hypothetical protein Cgig2_026468 [Carnegiea gigantea]|uniref:Reverse transcriptase zinc-binding domain-containing protein n=1 Tax=Carnegiea gigantea TaxID=171969 RepID=A0A9Q1GH59_9CARY|nr:hypothetical protein Cgig2_026468 [Carnegiea gigantea]